MTDAIEFKDVSRHYGDVKALDGVSFTVQEGEFFSMLGPSGSGKTTSLRLMAGFEQPSRGSLTLMGQEASGTPPYERDVNTVFQDYALFPHMNVLDNVAYGLMVRKVPRAERHAQAREALAMVALPDHAERTPAQLSGGQRQRVALARALVNRPRILLLDEPLGALDMKLREQMQVELKVLHRKLGITFVYVTHDQGEALSMSDRIAVFNQGRIEQIASPRELYHRPRTRFVADLSAPVGFTAYVLPDPYRVMIDLPAVSFQLPPESGHGTLGLVSAFRFGKVAEGRSRIVASVRSPLIDTQELSTLRAGSAAGRMAASPSPPVAMRRPTGDGAPDQPGEPAQGECIAWRS